MHVFAKHPKYHAKHHSHTPLANCLVKPTPTSFACWFPLCFPLRCGLPWALRLCRNSPLRNSSCAHAIHAPLQTHRMKRPAPAVVLSEQIQPGSFEFALDHLVEHELDLSDLDARFNNDQTDASAYDLRAMRNIVRLAYSPGDQAAQMRRVIDSARGRRPYNQRIATVESVFANIRHNKRLNRFTQRGRDTVSTKWQLYSLVHHIEKLAAAGYGS